MQQIKIKSFRKKKNLTIESIKVQIFEKKNINAHKRYKTVEQTEKDSIFTHSKRYLQSISPKKFERRQEKNLSQSSHEDNARFNMRKCWEKEVGGSTCIKRRIFFVKEINQLKLAIRRDSLSKNQEYQRLNKKPEDKQLEAKISPILNDIQMPKSFSEKVKKGKNQSDVFVSDSYQFNLQNCSYQNSKLLKPLNISIDLPNFIGRRKNTDKIKQLQHDLLQQNRSSSKFQRMDGKYRQTQVSPWRTKSWETEQNFGGF